MNYSECEFEYKFSENILIDGKYINSEGKVEFPFQGDSTLRVSIDDPDLTIIPPEYPPVFGEVTSREEDQGYILETEYLHINNKWAVHNALCERFGWNENKLQEMVNNPKAYHPDEVKRAKKALAALESVYHALYEVSITMKIFFDRRPYEIVKIDGKDVVQNG